MLLCWRGEFSWPVTLESSLKRLEMTISVLCIVDGQSQSQELM